MDTAEARRLGEFEGSDTARGNAVLELTYHWERVAPDLEVAVREKFQESLLDAAERAPAYLVYATTDYSGRVLVPEHDARAELETDPEEIGRIRSGNPYKDEAWILVGQQPVVRVGARWGTKHIVNLSEFFVWFDVEGQLTVAGQPLWYYRAPLSMFTSNLWLGAVAKDIAEAARFAALLFPALIHYAGLILSFSPAPVTMIAGVFLSELGEEGMRAVRGEPGRSARELGLDFGKDVLINLTVAKIFGGGEAGGDLQAGAEAARIADKAANEARQAVLDELVHTEGGLLERALSTGEVRPVTDQALLDEGFTVEVEIEHAGGRHVYRQAPNGRWCRWSVLRVCELNVPTSSMGGTRTYYELEARIHALEGTDAPADLIEQFDRINPRSPDAEQLRRLTERVEFAERDALPSDPESPWEATARSEAERRPGRRPSASRPRTSAQSDFMKGAHGIIGADSRGDRGQRPEIRRLGAALSHTWRR